MEGQHETAAGGWLTERQARERLGGLGLDPESARRVLKAGLAGPVVRTRGATLYDACRVQQLIERASQSKQAAPEPHMETFVARMAPGRLDVRLPLEEQLDAVRGGWRLGIWTAGYLALLGGDQGYFPFLATVGGIVALGAEITGSESAGRRGGRDARHAFILRPAGPWFDQWRGVRLATGRGGGAWRIIGPPGAILVSHPHASRDQGGTRWPN
jgi:hypothetical protein